MPELTVEALSASRPAGAEVPLCVPALGGNERRYVGECFDEGALTGGRFVDRFERELAAVTGAGFAIATASGTSALHVALLLAGVEPGDEVLVPAATFVAPANAVRYVGARPVFVDAEPRYWQIDPDKLEEFLVRECSRRRGVLRNRASGRRVRALLPVHVLGHPVDLDRIAALADEYGLVVVEDAAEGLGARCRGCMAGSVGRCGCLSFNGNKLVTAGGGGAILTGDPALARRARYLVAQAKDDPGEYVHGEVGFEYRLSNLHAAVGVAQLERLDAHIAAKRRIAEAYGRAFAGLPGVTCMAEAPWASSTFWMYTIRVDEAEYGLSSRALIRRLADAGIRSRPLWRPVFASAPYRRCQAYRCEVAVELGRDALSLPCSVGLTDADQARVVSVVAGRD